MAEEDMVVDTVDTVEDTAGLDTQEGPAEATLHWLYPRAIGLPLK